MNIKLNVGGRDYISNDFGDVSSLIEGTFFDWLSLESSEDLDSCDIIYHNQTLVINWHTKDQRTLQKVLNLVAKHLNIDITLWNPIQ